MMMFVILNNCKPDRVFAVLSAKGLKKIPDLEPTGTFSLKKPARTFPKCFLFWKQKKKTKKKKKTQTGTCH